MTSQQHPELGSTRTRTRAGEHPGTRGARAGAVLLVLAPLFGLIALVWPSRGWGAVAFGCLMLAGLSYLYAGTVEATLRRPIGEDDRP